MPELQRHPATVAIMRHFETGHLPFELAVISNECRALAEMMVVRLPDGLELTAGLRKLLESKDCFVRAAVEQRRATAEAKPAPRSCGQCKTPFNEADRRADGDAEWENSGFCRDCIDNCYDGGADHRCVICVPKETGR